MHAALKLIFSIILVTMIGVITWASLRLPMWETPRAVVLHPWFLATLADTYFAFFTFWLWVAYKERSIFARVIWLVLIFTLGNLAMAGYMLLQLWRLPAGAEVRSLLLRQDEDGPDRN